MRANACRSIAAPDRAKGCRQFRILIFIFGGAAKKGVDEIGLVTGFWANKRRTLVRTPYIIN